MSEPRLKDIYIEYISTGEWHIITKFAHPQYIEHIYIYVRKQNEIIQTETKTFLECI